MTIDEAKRGVEKAYPKWRVVACTPVRNLYIFTIAGKEEKPYWRTPHSWGFPVGAIANVPVNMKTGEMNHNFDLAFDLSEEELSEYEAADPIYYEDLTPPKK